MRILEQGPDRLVLELRPVALMLLCLGLFLLFAVLGFGAPRLLPALLRLLTGQDMPGIGGLAGGAGMSLLGYASVIPLGVAVFLLKTRRLTFSRPAGLLTIETRGLLGRGRTDYPLAGFRGASLARSRSGNTSTTYRAILHFDPPPQEVPVTPYSTSGSGPARTVQAINDWLGGPDRTIALTGDRAEAALAALERLGIRVPR